LASASGGKTHDVSEIVVITGASAGLGRAIARRFAKEGAHIGLIARGEAGLRAAAEEVERMGGRALVLPCDVSDAAAVDAAAERVEAEFGPIDIWINNAMAAVLGEVVDTTPEEFRRVMEVTFLGSVHGAQAALKRMEPRGRGTIIQVGSALGRRGIPLQATYCSAKHAVQGCFESLRTELRHRGSPIHLGIVQMPGMNTTQFGWVRLHVPKEPQPVAPIYQPEVGANAVYWAAHHRRRELWVGFPTVYTILGNRIAPWLAEAYLAKTAFKGQQTDKPAAPGRPDYLEHTLDDERDHGSHGSFDDRSHANSPQAWLAQRRGAVAGVATAALGAASAAVFLRRSR
jgi:NAD(P)-dependent dehydrogenase (short-subunit alcohol dehydrogenase family)